jgi:uncharacterized protein YukE
VAALTPADVKRWDADAIHGVFQTATNRAATLQRLGDSLQQVHNNLSDWQGEAGDAFRVDLGKTRRDIDADGQESKQVAAAVSRAEADVRSVKSELDGIDRAAEGYGWTITLDWRIDPGNTMIGLDRLTLAAEQQLLQGQLDTCKLHAHNADQELATAVRGSVGDIPLDATGHQPGAASPAAVGGKPPSLEDMMLGRGQPADPGGKPPPGSLPDLLSRLGQPGSQGAPAPQLNPADVESFKAMARQTMIKDGVPPDQIEAKLNAVVANTQRWMDNGMPRYVAPEGPRPPPPGFGEGFGDRWFATEQGIKNLIGQGGPGAPGVLQSWEQMLKGTLGTAQNPMGAAMGELQHAVDSPSLSYYLGEKGADAAFTAPTLMFGGEGAAVEAGLPAEVVTEGGAPLAVMHGWDPLGGMSSDDFASHFGTPDTRVWPGNDGFPAGYEPQPAHLPAGTIIDRFGSEYGRYLAPDGTPFGDRALPPESVGGDYNRYMLTGKALPPGWQILEGPVEPFYSQTPSPGTLQYMIAGPDGVKVSVKELLDRGIFDEYGPRLGR